MAGGAPAIDRFRQGVGLRAWATAAEQARLVEGEQALIRQLQEGDRLKRDLLATVSHELKTPLTVILGTLSRRGAALDPAERPLVDAAEVARDALAAARVAHPGRELALVAREGVAVRAAPEAVLQVLGNLLDNPAKYSPGPVRLEATRCGPMGQLAVTDPVPPGRGARFELRLPWSS